MNEICSGATVPSLRSENPAAFNTLLLTKLLMKLSLVDVEGWLEDAQMLLSLIRHAGGRHLSSLLYAGRQAHDLWKTSRVVS